MQTGIWDEKIRIRDKHPRSATLVEGILNFLSICLHLYSYINYINLPNRQPGDGIGNVCAARQAVTGVQSLARVAGQRGVSRELMHRKYVLVLGLQVVDHA